MVVINPFITNGYLSLHYFVIVWKKQSNCKEDMIDEAVKGLLEKDFITQDMGVYTLYDRFFAQWLLQQ